MSQQAKIIKYFVKSSPVNELGLIMKDIEKLAGAELLQSDEVKLAIREHYEMHRQQFTLSDGRIVFVNKMWRQNPITDEDGTTHEYVYFDQKHNVKFSFDPFTMAVTERGTESDFPIELDEEWGAYKTAVNEEVDAYVERQYTKNKARASICFNEEGKLQVDISCISTNLGKFWTGEWQSQFLVDIQGQTMTGSVRINSHFWENGNVQFNLIKNFDETALAASDGVSIVAAIEKLETRYQSEVENVLENMKEGMFKKLRRVLPVTGQSYDWSGGKLAGM